MKPIVYRPARADELQATQELIVRSINDLTVRHGFGPMASLRLADFQLFSHQDDPDGFWVAEADGEMLGCAFSWVADGLWFLAELFVVPGQQGRGIGQELLARTFEHARKSRAVNRALITFTFNTVSQGVYIRHGLLPRLPVYMFSGEREKLRTLPRDERLRYSTIENIAAHRELIARVDGSALGLSRARHHGFLLGNNAMTGVLLHAGDECAGYAYINTNGHVGPLAVAEPGLMRAAFLTALDLAADTGASQISAFLPGVNDAALGIAVAHGMRITFPMVLVSERAFGDWSRYLPRNPGFM